MLGHLAKIIQEITKIRQNNIEIDQRLKRVEAAIIRIENDREKKLPALFEAREAQLEVSN